ncbi:MAG: restriction endonuclease subunit S [Peptococcaceae bacterium]|nr:restriction endonuclease subunit S [Peptococcaceae bacterium]
MANFTSYEIPVPPIAEQERIVARIEELFSQLDKAVETLKIIKEQLAVYQQAVLKAAFEGKLTTTHVNLDVELTWLYDEKIKQLPILPSEWRYINLSELGDLGRGKSKHRPRNAAILFENGKYPFIQTGEVKAANKYVETYSNMYGEFGLQQSKLWPKGTLCITIAANIAETAFLGMDACFPDSVVGFTANEYVFPEYVRYFIEASKIRLSAYAPATAQKNINLATLENLVVPYCALTEQKIIVQQIEERLSICDNIEKTVDVILQQTEAMRQSILKQAFEGELV